MLTEEMRLDGNAAAGPLRELFVRDLTEARATCARCQSMRPVGALLLYAHGMGLVLRCPGCDAVLMRLAHTRGAVRLDMSGVELLEIPDVGAVH